MPPVLSMSTINHDYDTVQPYFFLDGGEENFYPPPRSQLLPGPDEDIWKKFELLPTPPLSPNRSPVQVDVPLSVSEHLEAVSDLLDEDCNPSASLLQSFIIQDCMWSSSFAAATKLEKVVSERLSALRARQDSSSTASTNTDQTADQQATRSEVNTEYLQDLHAAATDFIDPSVVFPYTALSEKSSDGSAKKMVSELRLDSPPLSSSDSESEGDDDGDDDEEVDVVTVDRRRASRRSAAYPPVLKRSHITIHQHNYAAQQPVAPHEQPAIKRVKAETPWPTLKQAGGRRCWSPRSDCEDSEDRRRTHNVLERQRRNELKMSFLNLRDEVPAVANNEKAAKVAILKKATEFIRELRDNERRMLRMKDKLRKRSRELRCRLEQLRTLE